MQRSHMIALLLLIIPLAVWLGSFLGISHSCCRYLMDIFFTYRHREELLILFITLELSLIFYLFRLKLLACIGLDVVLISLIFSLCIKIATGNALQVEAAYSTLFLVALAFLVIRASDEKITFWRSLHLPLFGGDSLLTISCKLADALREAS